MRTLRRYLKIWLMFAANEVQLQFSTKVSAALFFVGKTFRFGAFLAMLIILQQSATSLGGYTFDQVIIFFFSFNFVDLLSQMFFRGVYMFSSKVRTGEFDYYLARPVNTLFRSLASNPDFNDVLIFIPLSAFFLWYLTHLQIYPSPLQFFLFIVLILNGLLIAMAFHILVLCLGLLTTEVDNTIMMYRGISEMGRFPIEVYREPFRWIVTFIIPIGIMMGFPARVLLGEPPAKVLLVGFGISLTIVFLALSLWRASLKRYTSASS